MTGLDLDWDGETYRELVDEIKRSVRGRISDALAAAAPMLLAPLQAECADRLRQFNEAKDQRDAAERELAELRQRIEDVATTYEKDSKIYDRLNWRNSEVANILRSLLAVPEGKENHDGE